MPQLDVKTVASEQIWASSDGRMKIFDLTLDYGGKSVKAKTYSEAISRQGWSGTVETYEKPNRNGGVDTFVKQPQREGGSYGGGGGARQPKDEAAIKAMWAIGQATSVVTGAGIPFSEKDFYPSVQMVATNLFAMVDKVKTGEAPADTIHNVPDEDITVADLGQAMDLGETPWGSQ